VAVLCGNGARDLRVHGRCSVVGRPDWSEPMRGSQILITGASNGIGLAAAAALAALGADIAIVGRQATRTKAAAAQIQRRSRNTVRVEAFVADLGSQAAVRGLAGEVLARYPRLDVLINNAGAMHSRRQLTEDGIELTWAVNHLAPFLLTTLLLDRLKASAPARVITTASDAHHGAEIPFHDLNAERSYRGFVRYQQSKLANILFTRELARRLDGSGATASCFHPGLVASNFNRNNGPLMSLAMTLLWPLSRTVEEGAQTLIWLASAARLEGSNGGYFVDMVQRPPSRQARDAQTAHRLWELSAKQCRDRAAGDAP
jgi:NAD(P)-dependent dehydrogenase (short-subunit alcohol dehydrogenase family)